MFFQLLSRTAIISMSMHNLSPGDSTLNKIILALSLAFGLTCISQASTVFTFLLLMIGIEIMLLGITITLKMTNASVCFLLCANVIGVLYALTNQYHEQLYQGPETIIMVIGSLAALLGLWVVGVMGEKLDWRISSRRKIFHLVPMLLLPCLCQTNYRYFTLMVGGALYLLFQIEFIRYLAFRECLFARPLYHLVPIAKWMEEFNQDREHHFWYTHIFLFMGLTFPYLYYRQEALGSIGLVLALADAGAAVVGGNYGTVPMPWAAPKTLAGCITFALILGIGSCFLSVPFIIILPTSVFCALTEVYSGSTDNITPVFVFITLQELMS